MDMIYSVHAYKIAMDTLQCQASLDYEVMYSNTSPQFILRACMLVSLQQYYISYEYCKWNKPKTNFPKR